MTMTPEELAAHALAVAKAAGAHSADAVFVTGRSTSVKVRLGAVEEVVQSRDHGLGLRVMVGDGGGIGTGLRTATTSTSDLSPESIARLVRDTVAMARLTAPDPFAGLPEAMDDVDGAPDEQTLDLWDEGVVAFEADRAVEMAKATEGWALGSDPRLKNSEGAEMSWGWSRSVLATSDGIIRHKRGTSVALWTTPVAEDGDEKQRDYWYSSARHFADLLTPEAIGREAARRTLRRLGARKPKSAEVPVIFDAPVASRLIGSIAGAANGASVYRDASWLCGKLGDTIAATLVNLDDNPWVTRGSGSRRYDGEGLPTRPFMLVKDGVLASWVLDTYTGKKLGAPTTRSAFRGLSGTPSPGTTNLWMRPGTKTPAELIADVKDGLFVTDTFGGGANGVTGDFSQGAVGIWIENGELAYPVNELTIASTLQTMWPNVDGIANDLDTTRATSAPTLRIARMTIAGG